MIPEPYYSDLIEQLKRHEGFEPRPYDCSMGYQTIGYGRNLDAKGITATEAALMLEFDLDEVYADLSENATFLEQDDVRKSVLLNMAFNLGYRGLLNFKRMWAALEDDDHSEAAREMLDSRWAEQVGDRAIELALQMAKGDTRLEND